MLIFIRTSLRHLSRLCNSNTSHVNLYHKQEYHFRCMFWIQIHLMLIFISLLTSLGCLRYNSNTSHVNLYHCNFIVSSKFHRIQIHLMLIFIYKEAHMEIRARPIQIHLMLIFIGTGQQGTTMRIHNSNTSHVNLYPYPRSFCVYHLLIQIHLMLIFITWRRTSSRRDITIQIHLMLIFIPDRTPPDW